MAIYVSQNGDIHLFKGDSGNITFKGIPTDKNYTVYFAISDPDTNITVGNELSVNSNYNNSVTFSLSAGYTDQLLLNTDEMFAVYQYGLKLCSGTDEYTVIPKVILNNNDEPTFLPAPSVVVHQKFVEGA